MAKLFAFEEMDQTTSSDLVEVTPEELEAPVEAADSVEEAGEIEDHAEAIDEAAEAADDLEEVQEVIKTAADEEGGLSPVAAEAIGIAVRSICARMGVEPKRLYSVYATENFSSASTRMANTKIAYESVGEFLVNLWEKIKAHVKALWAKIVAFWEKHFAATGRRAKTLEALRERVVGLKSDRADEKMIELTGSLAKAFGWTSKVNQATITEVLGRHELLAKNVTAFGSMADAFAKVAKAVAANEASAEQAIEKVKAGLLAQAQELKAGEKDKPLVGGVFFDVQEDTTNKEAFYSVRIEAEQAEMKDEVELEIPTKPELKTIVEKTMVVNSLNKRMKDSVGLANKEISTVIAIIDKKISEAGKEVQSKLKEEKSKASEATDFSSYDASKKSASGAMGKDMELKNIAQGLQRFSTSFAGYTSKALALNMKAVDASVAVVNVSLRHFKK